MQIFTLRGLRQSGIRRVQRRRWLGGILGLAAVCLGGWGAVQGEEPLAPALQALQGKWKVTRVVVNGNEAEISAILLGLSVEGDQLRWHVNDNSFRTKARSIDDSTTPRLIDLETLDGNDKGSIYEAIYSLEENSLRICADVTPNKRERPAEFASPMGTSLILIELERRLE